MKKSLIALAALATVGAAQAQSSVTVYGIIDTGFNSVAETVSGLKTTTQNLNAAGEAASSRLGFRGTEDLGGGLRANFVVEQGMNANTAVNTGSRLYYTSLQGSFGEIRVGRQNTSAREVFLAFDQLAAANVAGNLAHSTSTIGVTLPAHTDFAAGVQYISPRVNGFQVGGALNKDTVKTSDNSAESANLDGYSIGGSYVSGKFAIGAAFSNADSKTRALSATSTDVTRKVTAVGASYDFGVAKVGYIYNKLDSKDIARNDNTTDVQRKSHALSVSAPLSAKLVARAGYGWGEVKQGDAGRLDDIKGYQAGLNYNLSKRTMAYAIYGEGTRETSATNKNKTEEYSIGLRHSF